MGPQGGWKELPRELKPITIKKSNNLIEKIGEREKEKNNEKPKKNVLTTDGNPHGENNSASRQGCCWKGDANSSLSGGGPRELKTSGYIPRC